MIDPLGVSPSKGNQGTTRGKEKIFFDLGGRFPPRSKEFFSEGGCQVDKRMKYNRKDFVFKYLLCMLCLCW